MKLIHLSDLHLGKRVNEFPMIDDQDYILKKILEIVKEEKPDGVIVAGDVYDKAIPSAEAVQLFDSFLSWLAAINVKVFIISGNHDSAERIAFASKLTTKSGVFLSPVYEGEIHALETDAKSPLEDEFGPVNVYMMPFIKPAYVRAKINDIDLEIQTYNDAVRAVIGKMKIDKTQRNVLIAHQFVTGGVTCDSEDIIVGGVDNVDVENFADFDYVALGHLHGPQSIGRDTVRYSGSPLKYSFSEKKHHKSVTIVEMKEKGNVQLRFVNLVPKHDMRELCGSFDDVMSMAEEDSCRCDYMRIILTDENDVFEAMNRLRVMYPNIMRLEYDNARTRSTQTISGAEDVKSKQPIELFGEFFEQQNGMELSAEQRKYLQGLVEKIWEEEKA